MSYLQFNGKLIWHNNQLNYMLPSFQDYEGNTYNGVKIGDQIWSDKNLMTTYYFDGTAITNASTNADWSANTTGAYCWQGNNIANKNPYGALYNSYAIFNIKKLIPMGWRIPSTTDFNNLSTFIGGDGDKLKTTGTTYWLHATGTNIYGFNLVAGGERDSNGTFSDALKGTSYLWTSTPNSIYYEYQRISTGSGNISISALEKKQGAALRFIKN